MSADTTKEDQHTQLTRHNFSSFAVVILLATSVQVGFGAVDLAMIAPLGVDYVAAVGLADLIVMGLTAYTTGLVHVFASRLAIAEGEHSASQRLPVLAAALALCSLVFQAVAVGVALSMSWLLHLARQDTELIPIAVDYISVRLFGILVAVMWAAAAEALRICDMKNLSLKILVFGFAGNALLNYLFLYTGASTVFSSPAQAVALATMIVYTLMAVYGVRAFLQRFQHREGRLGRTGWKPVLTEFRSMVWVSHGVGIRHLNDYMGAIIPFIFIGSLGSEVLAAASVGAKIYTVFCRVPQACVAGTTVFYSYQVGKQASPGQLRSHGRRLLTYTAVPTAAATVVVIALSPWLVQLFGGTKDLDVRLAVMMLLAFMLTVPLYVLEATYTAILTVHQRGTLLSAISTAATYGLTIPLAWVSVFIWKSAFWAIALSGAASATLIVILLAHALHRDHWPRHVSQTLAADRV
ncbi:MATE family efflux transporter [Streptomyces longwoodensis]|uniref:MATE family efflux transporter n=1 Tax=Streptomyces longwoodensis TaxID=68231 RepID=UPI002DD950E8|nr:MATE family efflux transporter [Streptomyces longwoodensis]WRY92749.1 MATE family efflux transporter [Streptomyces longwoodensis]